MGPGKNNPPPPPPRASQTSPYTLTEQDAFGGGNNVSAVSLFNTCRQSGDHGNMNSWDRMPFLTTIKSGGYEASYSAALTETHHSMIIANYGASQGFDNDDGSSWYDTHDNFVLGDGFKMVRLLRSLAPDPPRK